MRWRAHDLFVKKRLKDAKFVPSNYPDEINISLDENGYIYFYQNALPSGFQFDPERDFLDPIPFDEFLVNENLTQNPGWSTP